MGNRQDEGYVREKLAQANLALATGTGSARERLRSAAIAIVSLSPEQFVDDESRTRFSGLMDTLTARKAAAQEGTLEATIGRLSDEQVQAALEQIWQLDAHYRPLWFFVGKSILDDR